MAHRPHNHRVPRTPDKSSTFTVTEPARLLEFVMRCLDGISRNKAKSILTHGGAMVDGVVRTHVDYELVPGNVVTISRSPRTSATTSPHYRIAYEDQWIVVVDKAPGVLSMPVGAGSLNMKTLLDRYFAESRQRCTAHVVHRLDCRTSGLMMYAKDTAIQQQMQDGWHERVFDRRYVAVVEGTMEQDSGTVSSYLKDNDRNFKVESSPTDNGGKWAVTHWRLLEQGQRRALIELQLETGRKNQIRVHMRDITPPRRWRWQVRRPGEARQPPLPPRLQTRLLPPRHRRALDL